MIGSLKDKCEMFVKNRDIMKNNFKWEDAMMHPLCASIYAEKELEINAVKIKTCKEIIKDNTGIFSNFKGVPYMALATMLSLKEEPETEFNKVLKIYDILKNEFHSSSYLPLSAFVISDMVDAYDYERIVKKAKDVYQKMKKEHPFLTSGEDYGFAVLTALSDSSADDAIFEIEKCYDCLRSKFFSANAVQSLSHTLSFGKEDTAIKCNKVTYIFDQLKNRNCKFGTGMELSVLGLLALTTENTDESVNDIVEVSEYLKSFKGFGSLGIGKSQRIMYSAILVSQEYKKHCSDQAMKMASVNSITSIIIAQQAAMAAGIASSVASSSASSN